MTIVVQQTTSGQNYDWLKTAIAKWMHRSNLGGDIPDFIMLAESRIRALLDSRVQQKVDLLTTNGIEYVLMPSDLLSIRSLSIPTIMPNLEYLTPDQFSAQFNSQEVGTPRCYTTSGDYLYLGPVPDAVYSLQAWYKADITPLSELNTTNALLSRWPNAYLWGALSEAAKFSRDMEMRNQFEADFQSAVASINLIDWAVGGNMRVQSDVRSV